MNIRHCDLCPNLCGVDRTVNCGKCKEPAAARICRIAPHMWEEPIISGTNGSGTVFFGGCSLGCVFCQNYKISHAGVGRAFSVDGLIEELKKLVSLGVHNINFVNPTHYAHIVKEVLTKYRPPVPVVYNTGGYDRVETLRELEGLIDVYLPDFKFFSGESAKRYANAENYPAVAKTAIAEMVRQCPSPMLENGLMKRGVIVRHLVLPGLSNEGVAIANYLASAYGDNIYISVMNQYVPYGRADEYPEINRKVNQIEYKRVVETLRRAGLYQVFTQDPASGDCAYIPDFYIE